MDDGVTTLSPDEIALLRLMAEVGVPLRLGSQRFTYSTYFLGQQARRVPSETRQLIPDLLLAKLIEKDVRAGTPLGCLDYVLTDRGREAIGDD